jgi:hypothetical protein
MSDNLKTWLAVCRPPETALKQIGGGRLKGMTDINPQWRYKAMTEQFGMVGIGWKYRVTDRWQHEDSSGQIAVFVSIALQIKDGANWSDDIHGSGGSMLIAQEKNGLFFSDEAYKMAETDALSVAMKQIGVAADIYMGMFNGSKYSRPSGDIAETMTDSDFAALNGLLDESGADKEAFCKAFGIKAVKDLPLNQLAKATGMLHAKIKAKENTNA